MRLRLTPPAAWELDRILARIAKDSPASAATVGARVDAVTSALAENPAIGRKTHRSKIMFVNTHPYPYLIFYRTLADELEVIAIRHGARNPRSMPARPR